MRSSSRSHRRSRGACSRATVGVAPARLATLGLLVLSASIHGCADVPVREPDVIDVDAQGVIQGSVIYVGPRPYCLYDGMGAPLRVPGVLMLTLVDDANPLPPEGTATQPASFLAIAGENLFVPADCPEDPNTADPSELIMRSIDFEWPQIKLAEKAGEIVQYRVVAFYDQEGDFNPFFTIQSTSTAGDVSGAAIHDATEVPPQFELVTFHSKVEFELGEVVRGVTVALGAPVFTEPPIFRVVDGDLRADYPVPATTTGPGIQDDLRANMAFTLRLYGQDHGPLVSSTDFDDREMARVLGALRKRGELPDGSTGPIGPPLLDPDFTSPVAYAWYHQLLDTNRDGQVDLHPILGQVGTGTDMSLRIQLETPVVFLQRVQSAEEIRAGIPAVGIQGASPNRNKGPFPNMPEVEYPDAQVMVPPIAALLLNTDVDPACQVPYMAPGTAKDFFGFVPGAPIECAELPTGPYSVTVMHGMAGGTISPESDTSVSQTGFVIDGGNFGSQIWQVPNALGDPAQIGELVSDADGQNPDVADAQSVDRTVWLVDSDPSTPLGRQDDASHVTACFNAPSLGLSGPGVPDYQFFGDCSGGGPSVEDTCCEPIMHLCNVPRCPYDFCDPGVVSSPREGLGRTEHFTYVNSCGEVIIKDVYVPECIPFNMPFACCDRLWMGSGPPAPITTPFDTECGD